MGSTPNCLETETTGLDLKVARVRLRVTAVALSREVGVSPQRLYAIERELAPSYPIRQRYLGALHRLSQRGDRTARW